MTEFKTPTTKRLRNRLTENPDLQTPIKIPASPFLEKIGYGTGVSVFTLERSPRVGFTRSPWAIKKRNRAVEEDRKYNERIRLEAEVLRKLNHPNIVGFRAFTEVGNGEPCLAMEKLDMSLGDMIEDRLDRADDPFPACDILKITYEIIKGLEYLHHNVHILHGDIKSYNVLCSQNYNRVKLCDFGVSVPLTESLEMDTSKGNFTYVGTDCWSAPEIIFEGGPVTNKADIWPYGLIIWEMIALSVPHAESFEDTAAENSFDESISEDRTLHEKETQDADVSMNDSVVFLKEVTRSKYGTRPLLPAIELGEEYQKVLEIFLVCTTIDYKLRPSAEGLSKFFQKYIYHNPK